MGAQHEIERQSVCSGYVDRVWRVVSDKPFIVNEQVRVIHVGGGLSAFVDTVCIGRQHRRVFRESFVDDELKAVVAVLDSWIVVDDALAETSRNGVLVID